MKEVLVSCLLLTFLGQSLGGDLGEFTCSNDFCSQFSDTASCKVKCSFGFNVTKILNPSLPCDCCEYCVGNIGEGQTCFQQSFLLPKEVCAPGLSCQPVPGTGDSTCQKASTECTKALDNYNEMLHDGSVGIATIRPQCTEEGEFVPKRCAFGLTCHCVDENNNRIFGEVAPGDPLSLEMDCECARDYAKAKASGLLEVGFQRCLANGNYDSLQCVGDLCFCISKLLAITEGPFPRQSVQLLSCFNTSIHPLHEFNLEEHNYHPCELLYKRVKDEEENYPDVTILGLGLPVCQPDGFYHRVQEINRQYKCVDPKGGVLTAQNNQDYTPGVAPVDGSEDYRCNCARTSYVLQMANAVQPKCCPNGSYRKWQCMAGKCFCVDHNGEQQIPSDGVTEVNQGEESELPCYNGGETSCW